MKIRNRNRKFNIEKIYIDTYDNITHITFIVNNKLYKLDTTSTYLDVILDLIYSYLEGLQNATRP